MKTTFSHRTKILKCERCKKMFTTGYALQYHNENAKRLCPMYKCINPDDLERIEGELEDRSRE
jgi:hypothetical protein